MTELSPALKIMTESMSNAKALGVIHSNFNDSKLNGQTVNVSNRDLYHFASCSYLGLEMDERIKKAAIEAVEQYGVAFSCSRTYLESPQYGILEEKFEQIFEKPSVVVVSTSLGHISWIPNVVLKNDALILDQQVHRSVQNASLMAKANGTHMEVLRHNRMDKLEDRIIELSKKYNKIWYMVDGVYSMFGDVSPLQTLYDLMDKYEQFNIYVDDAHGMSWAGKHGRGFALSQVSYHHPKMCLITSLGKGFGTAGGVMVFGEQHQKDFIRFVGSTLVFSGPLSPALLGASIASADIHLSDEIYDRQTVLKNRMRFFVDKANEFDLPIVRQDHSPICFIGTGPNPNDSLEIAHNLQIDGFFVNASSFPVVPLKNAGIRITINSTHSEALITDLLTCLKYRMDEKGIKKEVVMQAFTPKALDNF